MRLISLSFIFVFFLGGCTTITPPPRTLSWQARQTQLKTLNHWQLNGKIAIQTPHESGTASIDWAQTNHRYCIALLGPLSTSGLKLTGQPGKVTLVDTQGTRLTASSAEQLLWQQWGWRLPVSYLQYWIRGLPVPGINKRTHFDSYHRLETLQQQGTTIRFLRYQNVASYSLPQKILITSPAIRIKIMIYTWNTHLSH